jgi:hypothetical protein
MIRYNENIESTAPTVIVNLIASRYTKTEGRNDFILGGKYSQNILLYVTGTLIN